MSPDDYKALLELITREQDEHLSESRVLEAKGDEDGATQSFVRAITCRQLMWKIQARFGPRRAERTR